MKTLNRTITSSFFNSPDGFTQLKERWSELVNSEAKHDLTAAHHLAYAVLRGKDWTKGFTFPKDSETPMVYIAIQQLNSYRAPRILSVFDGILSPDVVYHIKNHINSQYILEGDEPYVGTTPKMEVTA